MLLSSNTYRYGMHESNFHPHNIRRQHHLKSVNFHATIQTCRLTFHKKGVMRPVACLVELPSTEETIAKVSY